MFINHEHTTLNHNSCCSVTTMLLGEKCTQVSSLIIHAQPRNLYLSIIYFQNIFLAYKYTCKTENERNIRINLHTKQCIYNVVLFVREMLNYKYHNLNYTLKLIFCSPECIFVCLIDFGLSSKSHAQTSHSLRLSRQKLTFFK